MRYKQRLLEALTAHPGSTATELAELTGFFRADVVDSLRNMKKYGDVTVEKKPHPKTKTGVNHYYKGEL